MEAASKLRKLIAQKRKARTLVSIKAIDGVYHVKMKEDGVNRHLTYDKYGDYVGDA